jgi:hypothetical protein
MGGRIGWPTPEVVRPCEYPQNFVWIERLGKDIGGAEVYSLAP